MTIVGLLILGIVVGSNNFAVALALGALGQASRRIRITLVFGVFEFWVPLVGMWLGAATARSLGLHSSILGGVLIMGIGLLAVAGGVRNQGNDEFLARSITRWHWLLLLAAGLSLDNLVIGFSLGFGEVRPLTVAVTICIFSVLFTWLGINLGRETRRHWERTAKIWAGMLLVGLGMANGAGLI